VQGILTILPKNFAPKFKSYYHV